MKRISVILFLGFILPGVAQASTCSSKGYTIIFINGILASNTTAKDTVGYLRDKIDSSFNGESLYIEPGQNPSALLGLDDVLKTMQQVQFWNDGKFHEDADVDTILNQIHSELTTQKVLLIGHSQGAFYANDIYYYLTTHGLSKDSVGVYAVASPANQVAGEGLYETSFNDSIIKAIRQDVTEKPYAFGLNLPLPANFIADITPDDSTGHLFVQSYLNAEPDTIVGDIHQALSRLKSTSDSDIQGDCFAQPSASARHAMTVFTKDHALSTAELAYLFGVVGPVYGAGKAIAWTGNLVASAQNAIAGLFSGGAPKENKKGEAAATFDFLHALNLTSISGKDAVELLGESQGAAAVVAVMPKQKVASSTGEVLGEATSTVPQTATTSDPAPLESQGPELSVPIPQPNPAPAFMSHADSQGGSGDPAPVSASTDLVDLPVLPPPSTSGSESTTTTVTASSTPTAAELLAANPPIITLSNWRSPNGDQYCAVINRTFDMAWTAPPGAVRYEVSYTDAGGTQHGPFLYFDDTQPRYLGFSVSFGLGWSNRITMHVTAYDSAGDSVTGDVSANDAATDQTGPSIVSITPPFGSTGVSLATPLQLVYSEELDPSTVSGASIGFAHIFHNIFSLSSGERIPVDVSLEDDRRTVDITPQTGLLPDEYYSIIASCAVKDLAGNHAADELSTPTGSWQFTTATST